MPSDAFEVMQVRRLEVCVFHPSERDLVVYQQGEKSAI